MRVGGLESNWRCCEDNGGYACWDGRVQRARTGGMGMDQVQKWINEVQITRAEVARLEARFGALERALRAVVEFDEGETWSLEDWSQVMAHVRRVMGVPAEGEGDEPVQDMIDYDEEVLKEEGWK
jgi:hypothetical protein